MADTALITRRAAFTGALVSAAALALPVAAAVRPTTLQALADKFREDCMALDPSIKNCWIGYDETTNGPRHDRVMSMYFEREKTPFVRRRSEVEPSDDLTAQWAKEFFPLSKEDKLRYAKIVREQAPELADLADRIESAYGG